MNYQKEEIESKNLDHLGIIDEIGIVEKINEIFLVDIREKVNTGELVKAIIRHLRKMLIPFYDWLLTGDACGGRSHRQW
ncbi:MAG: DUF4277 domain-containing protein [Gloeotrichia echinulata DEX184]